MTLDLSEAAARLVHLALGSILPTLSAEDRAIALEVQGCIDVGVCEDSAPAGVAVR